MPCKIFLQKGSRMSVVPPRRESVSPPVRLPFLPVGTGLRTVLTKRPNFPNPSLGRFVNRPYVLYSTAIASPNSHTALYFRGLHNVEKVLRTPWAPQGGLSCPPGNSPPRVSLRFLSMPFPRRDQGPALLCLPHPLQKCYLTNPTRHKYSSVYITSEEY